MAIVFLEPGGDATFNVATTSNGGFWNFINATPAVATDFVHGTHKKSIKYSPGSADIVRVASGTLSDAGARISFYVYLNALPSSTVFFSPRVTTASASDIFSLQLTAAGVLQLANAAATQLGSDGATLSTGQWYRICLAYTITSTSVNEFRVYVNGALSISVTNGSLTQTGTSKFGIGNQFGNASLDFRSSDHYVDDSSALTDTGDIWVTAKRPNANGTTNGFTTQIGSGGSGYGTGHSPQINERALSSTNGWSMTVTGSAITEEYTIESAATGDIDISGKTIQGYVCWVDANAGTSETAQIIVGGSSFNISLTTTETLFTKATTTASYPTGGTAVGIITATTSTTVNLYECGVLIAYLGASNLTTTLTETATFSNVLIKTDTRTLSDTFTVTDTIQKGKVFLQTLLESFSVTDVVTKTALRTLVETFTVTDTIIRSSVRTMTETITVTGSIIRNIIRTFSEMFTATATATFKLNGSNVIWLIQNKSSNPTWTNMNINLTNVWIQQDKSSAPTWTNINKN